MIATFYYAVKHREAGDGDGGWRTVFCLVTVDDDDDDDDDADEDEDEDDDDDRIGPSY